MMTEQMLRSALDELAAEAPAPDPWPALHRGRRRRTASASALAAVLVLAAGAGVGVAAQGSSAGHGPAVITTQLHPDAHVVHRPGLPLSPGGGVPDLIRRLAGTFGHRISPDQLAPVAGPVQARFRELVRDYDDLVSFTPTEPRPGEQVVATMSLSDDKRRHVDVVMTFAPDAGGRSRVVSIVDGRVAPSPGPVPTYVSYGAYRLPTYTPIWGDPVPATGGRALWFEYSYVGTDREQQTRQRLVEGVVDPATHEVTTVAAGAWSMPGDGFHGVQRVDAGHAMGWFVGDVTSFTTEVPGVHIVTHTWAGDHRVHLLDITGSRLPTRVTAHLRSGQVVATLGG